MSVATVTAADLRPVDLFDDVDEEVLAQFAAVAVPRDAHAGDVVFEAGVPVEGMVCLLAGEVLTTVPDGERYDAFGHSRAPTWIGAIATLTEERFAVRMVAATDCRLAVIPSAEFRRLAFTHEAVHRRIMRAVGPVMGRLTALEQNRERLAALGTMAAGLAHELNNPAAAAERAAAELAEALEVISATIGVFVRAGIERADAERIVELQEEVLRGAAERTALDALDASDAEEALLVRLEELGVPEAWRIAEPLSVGGVDCDWVGRLHAVAGPATPAALASLAASLTAHGLVTELRESTARMSALVAAVKAYAYVDRGGEVQVDIHEGLETTLTVLAHKLKHTRIELRRDYDRTLPRICVHGPELNQVWTNLIDNALDALGEEGTIIVSTVRDGECIRVDVADDGPGIPREVQSRVFDPFFTTKPVGRGTGLGLDTARRIVEERHRGSLGFETGPQGTTFHVWLPLGGREESDER